MCRTLAPNENTGEFTRVGRAEFENYLQKKFLGENMKAVRQIMLNTIVEGTENFQPRISTSMVKAMTLLALQPGVRAEEVNGSYFTQYVITTSDWLEYVGNYFVYFVFFGVAIFMVGMVAGYKLKPFLDIVFYMFRKWRRDERILAETRRDWERAEVRGQWGRETGRARRRLERRDSSEPRVDEPRSEEELPNGRMITDWSPTRGELRDYRILENEEQAVFGETWFQYDRENNTYIRRYKSDPWIDSESEESQHGNGDAAGGDAAVASTDAADEVVANYNNEPPHNGQWDDIDLCMEWMKEPERRRARRAYSLMKQISVTSSK